MITSSTLMAMPSWRLKHLRTLPFPKFFAGCEEKNFQFFSSQPAKNLGNGRVLFATCKKRVVPGKWYNLWRRKVEKDYKGKAGKKGNMQLSIFEQKLRRPARRMYLVNVGVNLSHKLRSPLFADKRFEFVSIPEGSTLQECVTANIRPVTYSDLSCYNSP